MPTSTPLPKSEILQFLMQEIFDPVLASPRASESLKQQVRETVRRLNLLDSYGVMRHYWSLVAGTPSTQRLGNLLRDEGFTRFCSPSMVDDFNRRFASGD